MDLPQAQSGDSIGILPGEQHIGDSMASSPTDVQIGDNMASSQADLLIGDNMVSSAAEVQLIMYLHGLGVSLMNDLFYFSLKSIQTFML